MTRKWLQLTAIFIWHVLLFHWMHIIIIPSAWNGHTSEHDQPKCNPRKGQFCRACNSSQVTMQRSQFGIRISFQNHIEGFKRIFFLSNIYREANDNFAMRDCQLLNMRHIRHGANIFLSFNVRFVFYVRRGWDKQGVWCKRCIVFHTHPDLHSAVRNHFRNYWNQFSTSTNMSWWHEVMPYEAEINRGVHYFFFFRSYLHCQLL